MRKHVLTILLTLLAFGSAHAELPSAVPQSRAQISLSFAPLVKQVAPAVVNIYAQRMVRQHTSPLFADPFFQQFFGGELPSGLARERLENSLGSGVLLRADGLIVTSNHVIEGADQIRVVLADRREFDATLLTADAHSDLAFLRVDVKGEKLAYLELKDSDEAEVGDLVLAIGDPFGVGQTVTSGIISAMAHGAVGAGDFNYYIQTDAAINPGNSGGALVTMDGKLVGINASIFSRSGGNLGIGFAVPSNMVHVLLSAMEQGKKNVTHPWLGIEGQNLTPELAASMNIASPSGVLVNRINSASPAIKGGLQVGDIITAVNDKTVEDIDAFHYRSAMLGIGSTADLSIVRKGQKIDIPVIVIAPPRNSANDKLEIPGELPLSGATLENLSPAVMEENDLHGVEQGVVVTHVKDGSPAAGIGLQPGDVIASINGAKIINLKDVSSALSHRGSWRISIQRGENMITVMIGGR